MKLKISLLFLLVFGAIGQTIFLNIDAKSNFLWENSENQQNDYVHSSIHKFDKSPVKSPVEASEVVVTIRQHNSEIINKNVDQSVDFDTEKAPASAKKSCSEKTKEERLICHKAKEAAKQKQNRISGSNHLKNSSIQTPTP